MANNFLPAPPDAAASCTQTKHMRQQLLGSIESSSIAVPSGQWPCRPCLLATVCLPKTQDAAL